MLENEYARRSLLRRFRAEVSYARDAFCEQLKVEWELNRALEEENQSYEDLMLWHNTLRLRAYDLEWNEKFIHFRDALDVDLSHDEACSSILRDRRTEALWDDIRHAYFGDDAFPEV